MLSPAQDRLAHSPELDPAALDALGRAVVIFIGLGQLGGNAARQLAPLCGRIDLLDCDRVGPENVTQGFDLRDVGRWKTEVRAEQIAALSPDCDVRVLANERIEELGRGALAHADLIVAGLDSRSARVSVQEHALDVPWVDAGVDGSGAWLHGYVTLYDARRGDAACYRCPMDGRSLGEMMREGRGPGCPNWRSPHAIQSEPTYQAPAFCAIVAGFQAIWAVRALLGRADDLIGRQLVIDCDGVPQVEMLELARNPECSSGHESFELRWRSGFHSVGDLLAAVEGDLGGEAEALLLHRRSLVRGLVCPDCKQRIEITRLATAIESDEVRCDCRPGAERIPAELSEQLTHAEASRLAERSFAELGFPQKDVVTAVRGEQRLHYVVNQMKEETP